MMRLRPSQDDNLRKLGMSHSIAQVVLTTGFPDCPSLSVSISSLRSVATLLRVIGSRTSHWQNSNNRVKAPMTLHLSRISSGHSRVQTLAARKSPMLRYVNAENDAMK
jgi:hypothetical protein